MRILIDTNVLLDMALNRNENHEQAGAIIQSCVENVHEGYITAHSLCDFYYIIRKACDAETRKEWIVFLVNTFTILTEDEAAFASALNDSHFSDLEDQLQMECAAAADLDYIITGNLQDFSWSSVPALSSADFLRQL